MKEAEFSLEVYYPGSMEHAWVYFKSSTPFMPINVGEIVNPGIWEDSQSPMKVLRVVNVEHIIWETSNRIKQKVMVFTEEVEGTEELRISPVRR